ncbi:MAG: hypothetical protein ABEJ76_08900 [Halanaeroarchaeum sp.]
MTSDDAVDLFVETAPYPQTIECPECDAEIRLLIESTDLAGTRCEDCGVRINYVHDRYAGDTKDETEQTKLLTDGGTKYSVGESDRDGRTWTRDKKIVLGSWTTRPFVGHRHRHERVEQRLVVEYTHGVGVDILHEARSDDTDKFADEWQPVQSLEVREWGMRHERAENAGWLT